MYNCLEKIFYNLFIITNMGEKKCCENFTKVNSSSNNNMPEKSWKYTRRIYNLILRRKNSY